MRLPSTTGLRLRLPRPKTFLGCMSLQTGAEAIALTLLINKVTGFYGLLAAITGYGLTALQATLYLWSVGVVVAAAYLIPHVRRRGPFQNLALAWLYVVDAVANTAYTATFAALWYIANVYGNNNEQQQQREERRTAYQSRAEKENGGSPAAGSAAAAAAAAAATTTGEAAEAAAGGGTGPGGELSAADVAAGFIDVYSSMVIVGLFWVARIYFSLVLLSYARAVLRHFIASHSGLGRADGAGWRPNSGSDKNKEGGDDCSNDDNSDSNVLPNPFAEGAVLGAGWRGRLGRAMVSVGKGFWFGRYREPDVEWAAQAARARFSRRKGRKNPRAAE